MKEHTEHPHCPDCGIPTKADACPHCGTPMGTHQGAIDRIKSWLP